MSAILTLLTTTLTSSNALARVLQQLLKSNLCYEAWFSYVII